MPYIYPLNSRMGAKWPFFVSPLYSTPLVRGPKFLDRLNPGCGIFFKYLFYFAFHGKQLNPVSMCPTKPRLPSNRDLDIDLNMTQNIKIDLITNKNMKSSDHCTDWLIIHPLRGQMPSALPKRATSGWISICKVALDALICCFQQSVFCCKLKSWCFFWGVKS